MRNVHCFLYGFMYGGEVLCGKSNLIGWHTHLSQTMMEKLSLEVEKNLKLKSQLEETGDSKKVCTFSHAPICRWCHAVCIQSCSLPPAGTPWCSDRDLHLEVHCQGPGGAVYTTGAYVRTYVCVYVGNRSLCFRVVKQHLGPHSVVTLYYACEFTWFVEL